MTNARKARNKDHYAPVTEIFVTNVDNRNTVAYRAWVAKIRDVESQFPGFQAVHVQEPASESNRNWITLLQFDSEQHLDQWLNSKEREKILQEGKSLIQSLQNHRVVSPFAGWFAQEAIQSTPPPVWKESCLVLLVLFPIVMLQYKFLMPFLLQYVSLAPAMFISNAISVTLISWPMLPFVVYLLQWWLAVNKPLMVTIAGSLLLVVLYVLEIIVLQ